MFDLIGGIIGLSIAWWAVAITVASLLFPVFWVWMLVDSIVRDDRDYPNAGPNEKLLWVVLIALVQVVAVFYYFMVYRVAKRQRSAATASATPPAATAC